MAGLVMHVGGRHVEVSSRRIRASIKAYPARLKSWLVLCLTIMAVSVLAALAALPVGWEVMGTSPTMEWGLLIAGYVVLAITTSGLCLTVSLSSVYGLHALRPLERRGVMLALICLAAAFGTILLDLQYPLRLVFGAVLSPSPQSSMWWMGVAYAGYLVILLIEVITMYTRFHVLHQWSAALASVMAVVAPFTLGTVFGRIQAHSLWEGIWTPILMLCSAFLAGVSLLSIVAAVVVRFSRRDHQRMEQDTVPMLQRLLALALIVIAVLVMRELVVGLASTTRGLSAATMTLVSGPFSIPFWVLRVGIGLVLPLALLVGPSSRKPYNLGLAGVGALIGVVVDRLLFVLAGLASPVSAVAGNVDFPFAVYVPSLVEVLIMMGALATIGLGYALAEHHLNLGEPDHHAHYGIVRLARRLAGGRP
jgi:molybdopterin-containing oxidoreductase family membrane subunit